MKKMNRRTVDLRDASRQDIIDICSAIEQVFLFYEQDEVPYIYVINLLELLIQSARTRVCILRLPKNQLGKEFTFDEVKKDIVIFANFRDRILYHTFCKELTKALNEPSAHFLSYELIRVPTEQEDLYFCLPRITVRTGEVQLDHTKNPEAYSRIRQLLQTMYLEKSCWGVDLLSELYQCLVSIPHDSNLNCPETCNAKEHGPEESLLTWQMLSQASTTGAVEENDSDENVLEPIYEWVDNVYVHASDSRLTTVLHHDSEERIDYSNIFFFLRVNKPNNEPEVKNCDSFDVKVICPEQQRRELSLYYHRKQRHACQWYQNGQCAINGMPQCEFEAHWNDLPDDAQDWDEDRIFREYAPIWEGLRNTKGESKRTSEDAFRNNSVIFERYARHEHPDGETGYVRIDCESQRDRLMACIRYRLLPASGDEVPEEDQVPQVVFVPIYTGGAPFVLAASVVNANRPKKKAGSSAYSVQMSEWRAAYRFAGMVLQFMSSRLKEAARKAYLNAAADIMAEFERRVNTASSHPDIFDSSLHQANRELLELAKVYPYQLIQLKKLPEALANSDELVNDRYGRIFKIRKHVYEILITNNDSWCHYPTKKTFFSLMDVARKFRSARGRNELIRRRTLEFKAGDMLRENHRKDDKPTTDKNDHDDDDSSDNGDPMDVY